MGLAEKYFVKGPELWESSRLIYSSVLADTVAEHEPNTEDLGRLVMLKWTLGLSSQEVASCHHKVGFKVLFFSFLSGHVPRRFIQHPLHAKRKSRQVTKY